MNLLLDEPPILIIPSLAKAVGLNQSIILQQMHYWLQKSNHDYDGRKWIYNTYSDWTEQFPFWSESTVKRIITGLVHDGLLVTGNYNKLNLDRTKWYSVDYSRLDEIVHPSGQIDLMVGSDWPNASGQIDLTNTRDYTETTADKCSGVMSETERLINLHYQKTFGSFPNQLQISRLSHYTDKGMEIELVFSAMDKTRENGKDLGYALGILRNQFDRGIRTVAQAEIDNAKREVAGGDRRAQHSGYRQQIRVTGTRTKSITGGKVGRV